MNEYLKEQISSFNPEAIVFDDLDDAIVGIGCQWGNNYVLVYDSYKCIDIFKVKFMKEDKTLTPEEADIMAVEWFDFNVLSAYHGPNTPIFITPIEYLSL